MRLSSSLSLASVACLLVVLGGCNVFSGLEGEAGNVDALYQDAMIALQQGDPVEAERQLRSVIEADPDHAPAHVKLATTLLQKQDIDVIDFVRIARTISDEVESGQNAAPQLAAGRSADGASTCSFPPDHQRKIFDPTSLVSFPTLASSGDELDEVQALVRAVMDGASPEVFARAEGREELTDDLIAEALLDAAIAYAAEAYVKIAQSGGEAFTFYYVTSPSGSTYMGYCAPDQETLDEVLGTVACLLGDLNYGRQIIRARAELLDSDRARELADTADEAYETLVRELDATCTNG